MFTGIIEEIGTIRNIQKGPKSQILYIGAKTVLEDVKLGDSIAVNGVCLTVTKFIKDEFQVDIMHETMDRSSLANISIGSKVNLERAMQLGGRFGGHIVSGHIDGLGIIKSIKKDDNAIWYQIETQKQIMKYIILKGSITIDGISLTVAKLEEDNFSVSIIPHTSTYTTLNHRKVGDKVNLENDSIGKYIEKLLNFQVDAMESIKNQNLNNKSNINMEFLLKNGF
ncbi:riboflavin synthase [Peptostreptococcus equinus]|uniref:Riboflavin synthase n=1 Tax=Peptostreptococcus equinus TaxID=3003601 RepID=A0ABY7JTU5_9FIRM|nr:riboflavin synthase [Peptostreptococcus sp. CBA3647]WAW15142.1 riboflavin synthase [Peptostreptococcus sp. CBA3647]